MMKQTILTRFKDTYVCKNESHDSCEHYFTSGEYKQIIEPLIAEVEQEVREKTLQDAEVLLTAELPDDHLIEVEHIKKLLEQLR